MLNKIVSILIVVVSFFSLQSNASVERTLGLIPVQDSGRVKPFDTLTVAQSFYGKYNTPKGQPTPADRRNIENTPLRNAIAEFVNEETKIFVKDMVDLLKSPIVKK